MRVIANPARDCARIAPPRPWGEAAQHLGEQKPKQLWLASPGLPVPGISGQPSGIPRSKKKTCQ